MTEKRELVLAKTDRVGIGADFQSDDQRKSKNHERALIKVS